MAIAVVTRTVVYSVQFTLTFLHCAFSLTFLHCAFSNVVGGLCHGAQATTAVTGFTSTFLHCVVRCGPAFVAGGCDTTAVTEFTWIMETDGRQPGGLATL